MPENTSDIVIIDELEACPYLEDQTARMPLRVPRRKLCLDDADQRMAEGQRRTGEFIYEPRCPNCTACVPLRLDCQEVRMSRSQRRVLRHGDSKFTQRFGPMQSDHQRVELFNKHRKKRGLAKEDAAIDLEEYTWGFVKSCFETFEISYWLKERLVGLAVCDLGRTSLSAVYTYYDPDLKSDSLGTYSILKQIQLCQQRKLKYLYLGYYVAESSHMNYKTRFTPNQRLINGTWKNFK